MTSTIERYHEATSRLDALIEATPAPKDLSHAAVRRRADVRMDRLRRFLERLGNPHRGYPIVHVGGTSGKGSTSTAIAAILTAAGYATALHTSPYLQTPAEKLQRNGALIAPDAYVSLVDRVLAEHDRWQADGEPMLTYGEIWFALTALYFRTSMVDLAVLEVGAGGRFDLTNIVTPALSIITSIGIDHTNTLGNTIEDIAWHKAGIVKPGVPALTAVANPVAFAIIADEARRRKSSLRALDPEASITNVSTGVDGTVWTDVATGITYRTGLRGRFQARNGATALAAIEILASTGLKVPQRARHDGLAVARIPGRAELIIDDVPVLIDGAHNPEKIRALTADVEDLIPVSGNGRRIAVLGVLEAKQAADMIRGLVPVVDVLVATSPQVLAKEAKLASSLANHARAEGFTGDVILEPDPMKAMDRACEIADPERGDAILVTGSLYLVGNVRERWFIEDDIVLARTSWPGEARPASGVTKDPVHDPA